MERDLKADLELCEKATPGPWESNSAGNWYGAEVNYWQVSSDYAIVADLINNKYDAEFIAEAREALPYWLGRVVELEATVLHLQTVIKGILAIINQSEGVAGWHLNGEIAKWEEFGYPKELEQALSGGAEKEMLERMKRLEAVAEVAKRLFDPTYIQPDTKCNTSECITTWNEPCPGELHCPEIYTLRQALAALDGDNA